MVGSINTRHMIYLFYVSFFTNAVSSTLNLLAIAQTICNLALL